MKIKWDLLEKSREIINDLDNSSSLIRGNKIEEELLVKYRQVLSTELILIIKKIEKIQKEEELNDR